jgi:hypothetical protein
MIDVDDLLSITYITVFYLLEFFLFLFAFFLSSSSFFFYFLVSHIFCILWFFFWGAGREPRALCMLGKHSITEHTSCPPFCDFWLGVICASILLFYSLLYVFIIFFVYLRIYNVHFNLSLRFFSCTGPIKSNTPNFSFIPCHVLVTHFSGPFARISQYTVTLTPLSKHLPFVHIRFFKAIFYFTFILISNSLPSLDSNIWNESFFFPLKNFP